MHTVTLSHLRAEHGADANVRSDAPVLCQAHTHTESHANERFVYKRRER